jgi:prepilin-type N-terminal cleavage/methylation domain-containing protein
MKHQGFTLIEFVVIISIFAIMATVALFNFSGFRSNVALNNLSHDIALTLRQAQVFGWAGQTVSLDASGNPTRYADGVYFKFDGASYAKEFILYAKGGTTSSGREYYIDDPQTSDQTIDTIKIQGPNHISDIRMAVAPQDLEIDHTTGLINSGSVPIATSVSVAFSRPRPEALFFSDINQLDSSLHGNYMGIYIAADATCPPGVSCLKADHVIIVSRFGEITVQ